MARHKSAESKIQADPVLFSKMCEEIHTIGPVVLDKFGLVSRTTIHEYTKGRPITATAEQGIIDSIRLWKEEQDRAAEARRQQAEELLAY